MRRVLLGLLIGLLAFGAGAVGAKVVNVANPMTQSLDAGGQSIYNASEVVASSEMRLAPGSLAASPLLTFQLGGGLDTVSIFAVSQDPNSGNGQAAPAGSMVIQTGPVPAWWFKSGSANQTWVKVTP